MQLQLFLTQKHAAASLLLRLHLYAEQARKQMLKPCSTAHMPNALLSQNGAVLSIVRFGIVPGPWLPVSCTLFGLPTLAKKHAKEPTNNKTVPQSWDSIQVQALSR